MKRIALIGAMLLLGGCNMVITDAPLFAKSDAAGAPGLRPGIWAAEPDASCAYDEHTPLADWPSCASGGITREGALGNFRPGPDGKPQLNLFDYVLTAGKPRILQLHVTAPPEHSELAMSGYFYGAIRATKADAQGRITEFTAWPVLCGPPPPDTMKHGKLVLGTRHPFAGMAMDKDGVNCSTKSQASVLGAATSSEQYSTGVSPSHWVRDGER